MRLRSIFFATLFAALGCPTSVLAQKSTLISGRFVNTPFVEFVESVEKQTNYHFFFDQSEFYGLVVNIEADNVAVSAALDVVFSHTDFHYVIDPEFNVILTRTTVITGQFEHKTVEKNEKSELAAANHDQPGDLVVFQERKTYVIGSKSRRQGDRATISGYVRVAGTNTPVVSASVAVQNTTTGSITDDKGFYSISLPHGTYQLKVTSVGMKSTYRNIVLNSDGTLLIEMAIEVTNLQEMVVTAGRTSNVKSPQMGVDRLDMQAIKYVPTSFGEVDVLKAVLTLPGVKSVGEASNGFNVRGGAADQNLILFNESTIYNPFHFFGFFSSFSSESISNVELYKSVIPANYGGRLSSVLKITGRKGDKEKFRGSAGIGLLTSRVNVEGPIVKNKTSYAAAARTTYSNWLFGFLPVKSGYKNSKASFYDVNLNIDHSFNSSNSINVNGYISQDESNLNTDTTFTYKNRNASVQWIHDFNEKLSGTFTVGHDHYEYGNTSTSDPVTAYKLKFSIDQTNLKAHFSYEWNSKLTIQAGFNSIYYTLKPGTRTAVGEGSEIEPRMIATEQASENALYVDGKYDFNPKLSLQAGIRYSLFSYLGAHDVNYYAVGVPRNEENKLYTLSHKNNESIQTYQGPEIRLSTRYAITNNFSVKAGYTTMRQYIHMLSNTVSISPTDIWKLSDPNIKPQFSEQISFGVYKNFSTKWETSVEAYTKRIKNYLDYKSGAILVMNPNVETEVLTTRGKGYGVELMVKKPVGNFNGWISYTYSRILLKMDDPYSGENINKGQYYPASYDKPHDFNFTGNQKLSHRVSISMNLNYSTGRPVTIPIGIFSYGGSQKTLYSTRNGYRIPDYFRMDISLNIEGNHRLKQLLHNSWTIGVYNLTGRRNPYSIYYTTENGIVNGYKLSIFGSAIPFINYNIRF